MKRKTTGVVVSPPTTQDIIAERVNFRNSLEMSPLGVEIIRLDGGIIYVNRKLLDIWGYNDVDELKNVPLEKRFMPDSLEAIKALKNMGKQGLLLEQCEMAIIRKDGQIRFMQAYPGYVSWNAEQCAQVFFEDITGQKKAELDLLKEQESFRKSIEISPLGIQIIDLHGKMVYANQTLVNIWGYSNYEELSRVPLEQRFSKDTLEQIQNIQERRRKGAPPAQHDITLIRKDGRLRTLHAYNAEILWNAEYCSEVIYEDVTERRQIEDQLKREQENFRNSIEMSPLGITIVRFDGDLVYANQVMLDFWGYRTFEELISIPREQRLTRDSVQLIADVNEGRRKRNPPAQYDITIICKNGQHKNLHAYNKEIMWNGERCAQVLHEDVTAQKQAQERLKIEQENFHNSLEMSPLGIQIVSNIGEIVYANPTLLAIWGFETIDELRVVPFRERFTADSVARIIDINRNSGDQGVAPQYDVTIICKDGRLKDLHAYNKEVIWNGEKCGQILYEDVTERRQIEEQLKREQENFRNSIEMSPLGVQIVTEKGVLVWANRTMLDMWGYGSIPELLAVPMQERFTPETVETIETLVAENQIGAKKPYELMAIRKNGEQRHWWAYPKDIIWDGQPYVQTIYQDITERDKAEAALRFSNAAFQSIHEAVWAVDNKLIVTHWNAICEKIFNINSVDAVGKPIRDIIEMAEAYPGQAEKRLQDLRDTGYHEDEQLIRTPGGDVWLDVHSQVIEANGERFGWVSLAADITERKRVEDALVFKNTLLEAQAENTIEGIRVNDETGKIVFSNKHFRDLWLVPPELSEIDDNVVVTNHMLSLCKNPEQVMQRVLYIQRSQQEKTLDILELNNGSIYERYSSPMMDTSGNYRGRVWYYRDITEPRRLQENIERAAEEWRTTFDSITDSVSIHDRDNRLIRVNKAFAEHEGKDLKEIVGNTCNKLIREEICASDRCPWRQSMQTGKPYSVEVYIPDKGRWVQESASPLLGNNGELIGTVNIFKDVTEFKQMEQKLIMSDRLASIGELVSGIAHELNNPLTGVIGFSQLLMEKDISEDIKEDLAVVFTEAQRAARIVKNLLTFARKHTPVKQLCQINTIIDEVLMLRTYEQKVNNIEVVKHLAANLPDIMLDYFQIQQAILNVVINAEYFMTEAHQQGIITVTTEKAADLIRISISDDGPGIAVENMPKIFDPFFTTKEVGKGTGLGLSICHGIITEHGGYMYVRSEPGKGATFIIEFPLES
jgi:PAS domain S-box-containing protein